MALLNVCYLYFRVRLGWLFSFFAHQSRQVTIHCHCEVIIDFCFCGKATDATTTMVIARCFFQWTPLLLLVDCLFLYLKAPVGCGGLVKSCIDVFWQGNLPPLRTMAIAAAGCPPPWLCFFHGMALWPGLCSHSMQFAVWPMPTVQWVK